MKVKQQAAVPRIKPSGRSVGDDYCDAGDWTNSELMVELLDQLSDGSPRFAARAPGRLDLMGGSAACTGSLALSTSFGDSVVVVLQPRTDGKIIVKSRENVDGGDFRETVVDADRLRQNDDIPTASPDIADLLGDGSSVDAAVVVDALMAILRAGGGCDLSAGMSVVVGSELDGLSEVGKAAALAAGLFACVGEAHAIAWDGAAAAQVFCSAPIVAYTARPAVADVVSALFSEPGSVTQVRSDPTAFAGAIRLPAGVRVAGVHCGVVHPSSRDKFRQSRTAALMGRAVIDRIIGHEGHQGMQWDGYLSRVTITDYVERFRDRIPTKLTGQQFIDHFGDLKEPNMVIDPACVYKIRSRTEHHIYEHARAFQFGECLSRASRTTNSRALTDAGDLMSASHWSYGQRCGLGSIETDLVATLLRNHGNDNGIYGAKITGRGCGGVVVVLMQDSEGARNALALAMADYAQRSGNTPKLLTGSLPGAMVSGVRRI